MSHEELSWIEAEETPRKYFAMIPHLVDDLELSVYAYRLYGHLRRVVGESDDGRCWQSTGTLSERCRMSAGSVSKAKQELVDQGLIRVRLEAGRGTRYHVITIVDIWERNLGHYANRARSSGESDSETRSPRESAPSSGESARSPGETKKNPVKKEPLQEDISNGAQAPPPPTSLSGWLDLVRESSNRPATLRWMVSVIYPYLKDSDLPDYGYIGKVAKAVGGAGLLATLLWENAKHAPQGNVVSYVYQAHKNGQGSKHTQGGRSNGGNPRSSPGRRQSDWQARDPTELHERNKQQLAWMLEKHARWRQEREAA